MTLFKPGGSISLSRAEQLMDSGDYIAVQKVDGFSGKIEIDEDGVVRFFKLESDITARFPPFPKCPGLAGQCWQVEWCATDDKSHIHAREYAATMLSGGYMLVVDPTIFILLRMVEDETFEANLTQCWQDYCNLSAVAEDARWPIRFGFPSMIAASQIGLEALLNKGGEGWVLYPSTGHWMPERDSSVLKLKSGKTIDAWCDGYAPGGGKYAGTVGALQFGLIKGGELIPLGQCSGMTDAKRDELRDRLVTGEEFVIQVNFQRWSRSGGDLLHPQFGGERSDKSYGDCRYHEQRMQSDPVYCKKHTAQKEEFVRVTFKTTSGVLDGVLDLLQTSGIALEVLCVERE